MFCDIICLSGEFMDKKLNSLLMIDQEIGDFLEENNDLSDNEISTLFEEKNFVGKALKIVQKLSNRNIIELIKRSRYLNMYIDLKKYVKRYPLNKSYLKNNKEMYIEEYKKLRNMCFYLSDIAIDYNDFQEYMNVLDVDNVEAYLLKNMPNDQIYTLSMDTNDWLQKLYYFSFLKNKKSN